MYLQVIQAIWPPRVAVFFQFGRAPCASEGSGSTLREADVLATLPMYDPGMLASWYRQALWIYSAAGGTTVYL